MGFGLTGYGGLPGKGFWVRLAPVVTDSGRDRWGTCGQDASTSSMGRAGARIQFPAPPRYGLRREGSQERDLLPRVATPDHRQLDMRLAMGVRLPRCRKRQTDREVPGDGCVSVRECLLSREAWRMRPTGSELRVPCGAASDER